MPLDEASLAAVVEQLETAKVDSVAICLLHSYANPAHELRVAGAVRAALPEVFVTCPADVLPEIREYERTSTTVINAYVGPIVRALPRLAAARARARRHRRADRMIMQSNGGVMTTGAAMRKPAVHHRIRPGGRRDRARRSWRRRARTCRT